MQNITNTTDAINKQGDSQGVIAPGRRMGGNRPIVAFIALSLVPASRVDLRKTAQLLIDM